MWKRQTPHKYQEICQGDWKMQKLQITHQGPKALWATCRNLCKIKQFARNSGQQPGRDVNQPDCWQKTGNCSKLLIKDWTHSRPSRCQQMTFLKEEKPWSWTDRCQDLQDSSKVEIWNGGKLDRHQNPSGISSRRQADSAASRKESL